MIPAIVLIIISVLVAPSIVTNYEPKVKAYVDKLSPVQGWIGMITMFWGAWRLIKCLLAYKDINSRTWWFTLLIGSVLIIANSFILGYMKLKKHVFSRSPEAKEKAEVIMQRLKPLTKLLSVVGILFGVWMIIAYILF